MGEWLIELEHINFGFVNAPTRAPISSLIQISGLSGEREPEGAQVSAKCLSSQRYLIFIPERDWVLVPFQLEGSVLLVMQTFLRTHPNHNEARALMTIVFWAGYIFRLGQRVLSL